MLRIGAVRFGVLSVVVVLAVCVPVAAGPQPKATTGKVPITTSSEEARSLYLRGRELAEALRPPDARAFYKQAVEKDGNFAPGYVGHE